MVNEFLQYLQYEKNYSSHTVLSYHNDISQFCAFLQVDVESFDPGGIEYRQIQQWAYWLMSENLSARSVSRKISTLKSFWRFLLRRGCVAKNPTLKFILPKTKKTLPAFFKEKELDAVLDDSFLTGDFESVRDNLIIRFFYLTGVRLSELIGVKDVDLDFSAVSVRVVGKRNKERIIPLDKTFCDDVERYILLRDALVEGECGHLFVRSSGKKLYPKLLYNIVHSKMSEVSSLHKRSPHVLRHTFATAMLNGGADINAVKELLGHASLAATQVYTHTSFDELNNIYKHAHPRAK